MDKLEQTIISVSFEKLNHLQKMILEPGDDADNRDIIDQFSALSSLTHLTELEDSGLSQQGEEDLGKIDSKAQHLMRIVSGHL